LIKSIKVQLKPNNKQESKLRESSGLGRFSYNWALSRQQENYKSGGKFISDNDLRKEFTVLKQQEGYEWIGNYSNNIPKQAIKDACEAYKRFFKGYSKFPRYKSKRKGKPSFYVDTSKIQFTETHVKLEKLTMSKKKNKQEFNKVRLCERGRIPYKKGTKYYNPRVIYDGIHWWITVGIDYDESKEIPTSEGIGIDLGVSELAICSDGERYKNINKSKKMKQLEKRKKRLQRKVSKKYEIGKEGENRFTKTSNIIKLENLLRVLNQKISNKRKNYLHQTTTEIIKRKPNFIVLEDLNVSGMIKNRCLSKAIQNQSFYEFRRQIEYKSKWNNIEFIIAYRYFPSSKNCSQCGGYKKDLKLSDREYICKECGSILDRDYNASLNLKGYGTSVINQS